MEGGREGGRGGAREANGCLKTEITIGGGDAKRLRGERSREPARKVALGLLPLAAARNPRAVSGKRTLCVGA